MGTKGRPRTFKDEKEFLDNIQLESEKQTALNKAVKYISKTMKTQKQVVDYLKGKGYVFSALFFGFFFTALLYSIPHVLFITDTALFILSVISLSALIKSRALIRFDRQALVGKQTKF